MGMRNAAAAVTASVLAALLHPAKTSVVATHGGLRIPGAGPRGTASPRAIRGSQAAFGLALYCGCADQLALEGFMSWGDRIPAAAPRRRRRFGPILWALLPLLSWGLLAPVPFVHAAIRLRTVGLWLVAGLYVIVWVVVGPAGVLAQNPEVNDAVAGFSQLGLVVASTTHAFFLRERVFPPPAIASDPAVAAALAARQRREQARAIAKGDPALARELSIGRPDLPREFDDGGLVDVNHVPAPVLVDRLGLSASEAGRVMEARDHLGGFSSPAEFAVYAELPEATVEAVGDRLLFLGGGPER
jgi:hypothetical protein